MTLDHVCEGIGSKIDKLLILSRRQSKNHSDQTQDTGAPHDLHKTYSYYNFGLFFGIHIIEFWYNQGPRHIFGLVGLTSKLPEICLFLSIQTKLVKFFIFSAKLLVELHVQPTQPYSSAVPDNALQA